MSYQHSNNFASSSPDANGVDPSNSTMNGSNGMMNNNNGFGQMGHSYGMGNAGIADDELLDLDNDFNPNYSTNGFSPNMATDQGFFQGNSSMGHQQNIAAPQLFSNTPNEPPIRSPFANENFNYQQYGQVQYGGNMSVPNGMQRKMMERQPSDSRSPMTPRIQGLQIGTPDSLQQQAMLNHQAKLASNNWDGTPGSGHSWLDSPLASPHGHQMHHPQISEIIAGKHASVPAKLEGAHSASLPSFQSQEAKKKRRRESHNLVERRRRDNINERIQDLSKLVPGHRLEDEKVRKHINANGPLSPHGISPPHATSLLAGGTGRRATAGTITQGLPQEEKEKGPNKGDILNGAVAWMRDLMWIIDLRDRQHAELRQQFEAMGGTWPYQESDDESRMLSEMRQAIQRNGFENFHYSRHLNSGLRVPDFTNWAGEPLDGSKVDIQIKADPGSAESTDMWFQNGGDSGRGSLSIKEEDELGMDIS
ncbi:hypothetical protein BT63DRAFT_292026 [Microthyrium microscopicum]|uniref:BHLH domain-containing protein n=1 Tax=Microthyrium microscopicum TaxID=703497 RepID=A0A6A6U7L5_9PEZI|nr:hypothetical protein BT63DRAFT_292026 [Microthyrium microscopicum]